MYSIPGKLGFTITASNTGQGDGIAKGGSWTWGRGMLARWKRFRQSGALAVFPPGWQRRAWVWSWGCLLVNYCMGAEKASQILQKPVERYICWLLDHLQASYRITAQGRWVPDLEVSHGDHPQQRPKGVTALSWDCHNTQAAEMGSLRGKEGFPANGMDVGLGKDQHW